MNSLLILIPMGLIIAGFAFIAFLWSLKTGQYDDIEASKNLPFLEEEQINTSKDVDDK